MKNIFEKIRYKFRPYYNPYRKITHSKPLDQSDCLVVTNFNNYYKLTYMGETETFFNLDDNAYPDEIGYIVTDWQKEVVKKWKYLK